MPSNPPHLCRKISLDLFGHTLDLDLKFHLMRKTGEVTRVMDRGTSALQNIVSTVIFNIGVYSILLGAASVCSATAALGIICAPSGLVMPLQSLRLEQPCLQLTAIPAGS